MNPPKSFIIWFKDTYTYNSGCGVVVPFHRATRYAFREEAERINRNLRDGIIMEVPFPPSHRAVGIGDRWIAPTGDRPSEVDLVRIIMAHDHLCSQAEANIAYGKKVTNPEARDRALKDARGFQMQANALREVLRYLNAPTVPGIIPIEE